MLLIELLQRVANRFDAAPHPLGHAAGHVGRAAAGTGQPPRPLDDPIALFVGQLAELRAAADALLVPGGEPVDRALQKPDSLAAVEHEPPADQPLLPPAGNRLGRDIEQLAQFFDGQHLLAGRLGRHIGRFGQVFDEQPQIVAGVFAA